MAFAYLSPIPIRQICGGTKKTTEKPVINIRSCRCNQKCWFDKRDSFVANIAKPNEIRKHWSELIAERDLSDHAHKYWTLKGACSFPAITISKSVLKRRRPHLNNNRGGSNGRGISGWNPIELTWCRRVKDESEPQLAPKKSVSNELVVTGQDLGRSLHALPFSLFFVWIRHLFQSLEQFPHSPR